jgi:L-asparagine transporter-like permease
LVPLNNGFMMMFGISERSATALAIPAVYATAFGFIFSYGKLLMSMSESALFPSIFRNPAAAYIAGSVIGYGICLLVYFVPKVQLYLFNITMLSAYAAYTSQFIGFLAMRGRFAKLPREFRNPLGVSTAILGLLIFLLGAVSVMGFQDDGHVAFISYLCLAAVSTIYYFVYARDNQKFSEDESKILFVAHVMQRKYFLLKLLYYD